MAVVRVVLVTAGLGLAFWQFRQRPPRDASDIATWQYIIIGIAYGLGLIGILALRKGRFLELVAYSQVIADAFIVTAVVTLTGGAESVFAFTYVFVVLEGSLVLLTPGAIVSTGLGTVFFGTVILLQIGRVLPGVLPPVVETHAVFTFAIHSTGVGLVAFLASHLATKLRIAGRRLAEREEDLERLRELHAAILRALPAGLLTVAPDGRIRFGNESAHAILHRGPGQLVGRPLAEVLPEVAAVHEGYRPAAPAKGPPSHTRHEAAVVLDDGQSIRLGFSLAPLSMSDGPSTIVVFQDVTEVVRLEEAVERAERLALVGKFAAGLAHEVRNPLASMCASIDVLEQSLNPPEPMKRLMQNVVREAARLDRLIRDFLALARPRKLSFTRVDLATLVGGVLEMFENDRAMQGIKVDARLEPDVTASVDPDLVKQVIWNLVRNAAEAMQSGDEGGTLTVVVRGDPQGPTIEVSDTGPGLTDDQLRRAFDPFYTTKPDGSGLGLAISQSIINAHAAELRLEGRPSAGAKVTLRFQPSALTLDVPLYGETTPVEQMGLVVSGGR